MFPRNVNTLWKYLGHFNLECMEDTSQFIFAPNNIWVNHRQHFSTQGALAEDKLVEDET